MDRIGIKARAITRFHAPRTCGACNGSGGSTVTETSDGANRQSRKNCPACDGTGQR